MVGTEMEMRGDEIEHLTIRKPKANLAMNFKRWRIEDDHVAAILQSSHVFIHG